MRQFFVLTIYLFAQAGFAGGGVYFAIEILAKINGFMAFCFCLFVLFEIWMVFIYVLAPLMTWAKRADDRAWLRRRNYPHN